MNRTDTRSGFNSEEQTNLYIEIEGGLALAHGKERIRHQET